MTRSTLLVVFTLFGTAALSAAQAKDAAQPDVQHKMLTPQQ